MENIMKTEGVESAFKTQGDDFWALTDITVEIPKGKLTILRGRSGSGKTTLMNILGALDLPTEGTVEFSGREITALSEEERTTLRRNRIGFVFQSIALIPMMTAYENVDFALRMAGYKGDRKERVMECLHLVGLSARADHMPQELSGGEQQRIAIARAIAHRPEVIFADEPTGALDSKAAKMLLERFNYLNQERKATIMMVTHDSFTASYAGRVIFIKDGKIFHEISRGSDTRTPFFDKILDVVTLLRADVSDAL